MLTLDSLITTGIVVAAAVYLYRKFVKTRKGGGCGCASEDSCCGSHKHDVDTHCCSSRH